MPIKSKSSQISSFLSYLPIFIQLVPTKKVKKVFHKTSNSIYCGNAQGILVSTIYSKIPRYGI